MNLLTIRTKSRLKSGVASSDFSDANLDVEINDGYYKLASILSQLQQDYYEEQNVTFNLIANSSLYSLPTDLMQLKQVRLAYTTPTGPGDFRVARHYDPASVGNVSADEEAASTSFPLYDVTSNYFRVKPTPLTSVTGGGKLWYIARPSALTLTSDTPVLPTQYHDLLATYAAREMTFKYQKWDKHDRLDRIWNQFVGGLQAQLTDLADRDLGEELRFRNPFEALGNGPVRELDDN